MAMRSIVQSNPGEGPQLPLRPQPLTRIASIDAIRPLPMAEVNPAQPVALNLVIPQPRTASASGRAVAASSFAAAL